MKFSFSIDDHGFRDREHVMIRTSSSRWALCSTHSKCFIVAWIIVFILAVGAAEISGDIEGERDSEWCEGGGDEQHACSSGQRGTEWELLCVEKVFVINLNRRADKWHKMQEQLHAAGFMNVERIEAVDGRTLPLERVMQVISEEAWATFGKEPDSVHELGYLRTLGAVGCFLSHLAAWQRMAESGVRRALVLEDDVLLPSSSSSSSFKRAARALFFGDEGGQEEGEGGGEGGEEGGCRVDWEAVDLVLLGFHDGDDHSGQPFFPLEATWGRGEGRRQGGLWECPLDAHRWRGHAYVLTERAAATLVSEALPITHQLDFFLALSFRNGDISCVSSMLELIREPSSHVGDETDVQTQDTQHLQHFLPFFSNEAPD